MDITSTISEENLIKIKELFENMNDSPGKESLSLAMDWLKKHGNKFSGLVNGTWLTETEFTRCEKVCNSFNSNHIADIFLPSFNFLTAAASNSFAKHQAWAAISAQDRSRYLQKIADAIEKNEQLFAQVECLSSDKHMHQIKSKVIPNLIQNLKYYCSWAAMKDEYKQLEPAGVVCVIAEEFHNPLLSVCWKIGSLLASGNSILLLVDKKSCLSAFLLAELCYLAGLPAGVLNVLSICVDELNDLPKVNKVIFSGSHQNSRKYIQIAAKQAVMCDIMVPSKPVVIVYESADLHSACDGVLETLFFMDTRSKEGCCKVFVQESVQKKFLSLLEQKFSNILIGESTSKTDMSSLVSVEQCNQLKSYIYEAKKQQLFKVVQGPDISHIEYGCWKPSLICNVPTTSTLFEKIYGPVVITTSFRTVKESIAMFNCNKSTSVVSVWTERLTVGLEVAHLLKTRTVWLNSQNLFDASVPYGSIYRKGSSVEGGKEAFFSHLFFSPSKNDLKDTDEMEIVSNPLDNKQSYGQFIGGSFKKSESYRVLTNAIAEFHAYISDGKLSDEENACASAVAAQPKWESLNKYKRSQILNKAADALQAKKDQFVSELCNLTDESEQACSEELDESVSRLRFWANFADKCEGQITETLVYGKVLQERIPVGVIGIQCPNMKPLLSFVTLVIPAIAFGNAVIALASQNYPTLALKMCEILHSSGILPGVLNVITGERASLTRNLFQIFDIDAIWFCGTGDSFHHYAHSPNPKKLFHYTAAWNQFNDATKLKFVLESSLTKVIYMPMGSIFAN